MLGIPLSDFPFCSLFFRIPYTSRWLSPSSPTWPKAIRFAIRFVWCSEFQCFKRPCLSTQTKWRVIQNAKWKWSALFPIANFRISWLNKLTNAHARAKPKWKECERIYFFLVFSQPSLGFKLGRVAKVFLWDRGDIKIQLDYCLREIIKLQS